MTTDTPDDEQRPQHQQRQCRAAIEFCCGACGKRWIKEFPKKVPLTMRCACGGWGYWGGVKVLFDDEPTPEVKPRTFEDLITANGRQRLGELGIKDG